MLISEGTVRCIKGTLFYVDDSYKGFLIGKKSFWKPVNVTNDQQHLDFKNSL
jgi:hypothetical protein